MRSLASILAAVLVFGLSAITGDAEAAKRFGGGQSMGMQRQSVAPQKSPTTPPTAAPAHASPTAGAAAAGAAAAAPKRSWMGPLAGLAAGIGLAALASHFGFGEGLASMLTFALLAVAVLAVIGFVMRRRAATNPLAGNDLRYASATTDNTPMQRSSVDMALPASSAASAAHATTPGNIPADFDRAAFERNAKVNFIRLQAANDAGNLDDIREFTTPEMFAEIKMNLADRAGATQQTDVVSIEATVLDVSEESNRYIVSVRFNGLIREEQNGPAEPIDEIWHMVKPRAGQGGWVVAGIQQVQ